jgi:hypothetical protein
MISKLRSRGHGGLAATLAWALLVSAATAPVHAGPSTSRERSVHVEIEGLVSALGRSGCSFQRNGRWHDAGAAQEHLQRKYEWMRDRDRITSTEQFIADGASRSSMTGRAYQVRCPGQPDRTAEAWLSATLQQQRKAATGR